MAWGIYRTFGVFLEPLIDEFNWSRGTISFAFTLSMLFCGIFGMVLGRLNDRLGPRLIVTISGISLGAGYLLMSLTHAIWQPYLFQGLFVAIGMSGIIVPMVSNVARWFAGTNKAGLMTGIVVAGPGVGITVIPILARYLISAYDWRITFIILGAAAIAWIVPLAQFLKSRPARATVPVRSDIAAVSTPSRSKAFSLREAMHTGQFWLISVIAFGAMYNVNTVMVHVVIHATDIGISSTSAVAILSTTAATSIAGRIIIGLLVDRVGARRTLVITFSMAMLVFASLLFAMDIWMLYLVGIVYGLAGWMGAVISPMIAEMFGMTAHGTIYGVSNFIGTIGGALGPFLAGFIFDTMGSYKLAFIISAAICVAGITLGLLLKPTVMKEV